MVGKVGTKIDASEMFSFVVDIMRAFLSFMCLFCKKYFLSAFFYLSLQSLVVVHHYILMRLCGIRSINLKVTVVAAPLHTSFVFCLKLDARKAIDIISLHCADPSASTMITPKQRELHSRYKQKTSGGRGIIYKLNTREEF